MQAIIMFVVTVIVFMVYINDHKKLASADPVALTQQYIDKANSGAGSGADDSPANRAVTAKKEALDDISKGKKIQAASETWLWTKTLTIAAILAVLGFIFYYFWYFILMITAKPMEGWNQSMLYNFMSIYVTPILLTTLCGAALAYILTDGVLTGDWSLPDQPDL